MDYEKMFQDFYSKYYDKAEFLIKQFLIKRQSQNKTFSTAINEINSYLDDYSINKCLISKNENLKKSCQFFGNRYRIYSVNHIQEILSNEIKTAFDKLNASELPKEYNYTTLVKEIALLEALNEISRLLSNNARLLEMMYKLNEFDTFEIRIYENLSLEDFPIYKELQLKLYPNAENNDLGLYGTETIVLSNFEHSENATTQLYSLFINSTVYDCFLEYQKHIIDFYTDYSYLKKRLEVEKLIHHHKDNDFMSIVFEQLQLISSKNYDEYCINGKLKSLQKSYSVQRENNFNIVFDSLL
ncbi:MAG: hypothetical protein ABI426_10610 [Flavobacterium sp.]